MRELPLSRSSRGGGVFPNGASTVRLIGGATGAEQRAQTQHCYMQVEALAESTPEINANSLLKVPHPERREDFHHHGLTNLLHLDGRDLTSRLHPASTLLLRA